jgi:hypothetical protein
MKTSRIVTAVLVAGSASFGFLPLAHASTQTHQVIPTTEAWYQPNPTCTSPAGCVGLGQLPVAPPASLPALTAYPVGSMHIAVAGGQETARSYLSFALPRLDGTLTAASIDIPLDTAQADGSVTPESSHVLMCSFTGSITPASGSIDAPPTASCTSSALATYVATPAPHLHADLTPLLSSLSGGAGLALLPDPATVPSTDEWHVVFSAHDRTDAAKTSPATMSVSLDTTPAPELSQPAVAPPVNTVAAPPALGSIGLPTVGPQQAPVVNNPAPQVPVQSISQARTITVGYAYPIVWLLPLAFLLLVPVVARSLTRDFDLSRTAIGNSWGSAPGGAIPLPVGGSDGS